MCTAVFVSTEWSRCYENASSTCDYATNFFRNASSTSSLSSAGGWGVYLSIACDCFISIGLALQKVGHKRLDRRKAGTKRNPFLQPVSRC